MSNHVKDRLCSEFAGCGYFCVPYYQCGSDNKIITDGDGLIDPREADEDEDICEEGNRNKP